MRTLTFGFLNLNILPAGNATPHETLSAAIEAGFDSVGLRVTGRRPEDTYAGLVGSPSRIAEVRRLAADHNARISSVTGYGLFPDVDMAHQERVIETAAELGCSLMLVNVYYDDHAAFTEALAQLAERAERHGVRLAVEFMPFSGLRTLRDTERAIERVGRRNVGYVIDALHLMRSGGGPADVRRLDPERIFLGQLCDARRRANPPTDDELRAEARAHREYPGEGDAPLHELVATFPDNLEIEIEVPRSDFGVMSLAERARDIGNRFRGFMAEYGLARR